MRSQQRIAVLDAVQRFQATSPGGGPYRAENRAHQDVLGGCGAPPTAGEFWKIAEYLATLSP